MSKFASVLAEIPEITEIPKIRRIELEDIMSIHRSLSPESPELWMAYLSLRPDLDEQEQTDIRGIIEKLVRNERVKQDALVADFNGGSKCPPSSPSCE